MERAFITVLNMSITGSLIIAALLIIRLAFRKLPRKYSYALWAIPAFRLLCPISISSAISFFNLFKKAEVASNQMEYIAPPPTEYVAPTLPQNPVVTPLPPTYHDPMEDVVKEVPKSLSLGEIAGIIWLTVAAAIILWAVISYISVRRRVKGSEKADGYFICKNIFSPFVFGIFRPTIYLPSGLSEADTHCILEHERTHIQRKDYLIKLLTVPILALHWFNPLVWLGIRLMTVDMELSCDEMALKSFSADFRKDYANALLNVSMKQNGLSFGGVLGFGETGVKARIKGVLSMKKPKLWATVIAIVIVIVAAVCLTTNAANSSGSLPKKFDGYISYETANIPVLHYDEALDAADFKEQAAPKILFARAEAGDVTAYLLGEGVYREENSDALRVIDLKVGVSTDGKTLNAAYPAPAEFIGASQGHYTVYTDTAAISAYLSAFDMELPIIELNYIGEDSNIGAFYAVKDGELRLLTGDLSEIGGEASGVCFTYTALEKGSKPNTLVFNRTNSFGVEYVFDFDNIKADEYIGPNFRAEYVGGGLDGSGVNKLVKDFMIYERAFDYGSLDYASNSPADSVTIDGENYYPVTEEGFTDWQELYDFMHGLFSDDFADEALAGSPYREHDGKTYTRDVGGNGWSISDKDYRWYDGEKIEIWRPLLSEGDEGKYAITLLYVSGGKITGFEYHYTDSLNGYQPYADISEVNAAFEEFIIPPDGETITRLAEEYITENTDLPLHSYTAEYTAITDNVSGIQSGIIEIRYDSGAPYIRLTAAKLDGVWHTTATAEYADYNEYLSEVSGGRPDEVGEVSAPTAVIFNPNYGEGLARILNVQEVYDTRGQLINIHCPSDEKLRAAAISGGLILLEQTDDPNGGQFYLLSPKSMTAGAILPNTALGHSYDEFRALDGLVWGRGLALCGVDTKIAYLSNKSVSESGEPELRWGAWVCDLAAGAEVRVADCDQNAELEFNGSTLNIRSGSNISVDVSSLLIGASDEERALMQKLRDEVGDESVTAFEAADFDGDGVLEAFGATGDGFDTTLWFVGKNGVEQVLSDNSMIYDMPHLLDFGSEKFYTIELSYGTVSWSCVYGVRGGEWYESDFSQRVSELSQSGSILTGVDESGYDAFFDENGDDAGGLTYKTYYFYYDGGFKEYGGTEISPEEFFNLDGAKDIRDYIDSNAWEIRNIIYRAGVGIVNINCFEVDPEDRWIYNTYLTVSLDGGTAKLLNTEFHDGIMQSAMIPEIATYSDADIKAWDEFLTVGNLKNVTRNFDIMSVSVDIPESWQSYTLEDYSLQHIGIQLYDGAIPAQREMYGGKLFVAEAVSGFAQSYIESQEALGVSYDVSDYTAASGCKMKLCYRDGVLDYATFDDFKSMCIFFDLDEQDDMSVIFRIIDSIVLSAENDDAPEQSYSYDEAKDILGEAFEAYAQYTAFGSVELSSDGGTAAREIKVRKSDGIFTEYAYCFTARYRSRDRLPRLYAVTADAANIFVYDPEDETDEEFYDYLTTAESYKDVPDHVVFADFYAQAQAFYKFLQDIDSRSRIGYDQKATDEALSLSLWDDYKEASLFLHLHRRDNGDIITQGGSEYIPLNSDYDTMAKCEALLKKTFTRDFCELILKNQFGRNRKFSEFNGKMYAIIGDYAGTIVCDLPISGAVYDGENKMTAYTTITYDREGDNVDDYIFHLEKENGSWKIASIELPDYYADGSSRFEFTESYYYTDTLAAIETVREALETEAKSDYVISLEINDVSVDWQETYRLAEMYSGSDLAIERGWSDDDLNDRFLVISADCSAEYDHTKTSLDGGHIIRYFGLMYHEDSDDWEIIPDLGGTFSPA